MRSENPVSSAVTTRKRLILNAMNPAATRGRGVQDSAPTRATTATRSAGPAPLHAASLSWQWSAPVPRSCS